MDILHSGLEYFLKCAQENSFVEAAYKIGVTQPTLSSAIKKLEEDLGAKLFERSVHGVKLTPKGEALYQELSKSQLEIRKKIHASLNQKEKNILRIGCVGHLASKYFLDVLETVRPKLPIVHLYTSTGLDCYEQVLKGNLEFAIVAWSSKPNRLKSIRIADEPTGFVGLKKRFKEIEKITKFEDLKKFPWVDLPKPQRDWTKILNTDQPAYIARDIRILRDIILRGLAIGYLQLSFFTEEEKKKLAYAPIPPFYKDSAIYIVYKKDISAESMKHAELLAEALTAICNKT